MAEIKNYEVCLTEAQLQTLAENGEITIGQDTIKADEIEFVNTKDETEISTSISSYSTDNEIPTAKAVYDYIQSLDATEVSY